MNPYHVHFKVDQLSTDESNDHLPLIDSTPGDMLLPMCLPLVDTLVCLNVTNALRVHLSRKTEAGSHDPKTVTQCVLVIGHPLPAGGQLKWAWYPKTQNL